MAELLFLNGPDKGLTVELHRGGSIVVGRSRRCDLTLNDRNASRKNCRIIYEAGNFNVVDLKSTNGTVVNGRTIAEAALQAGDVIEVGDTKLRFVADAPAAPPAAPPREEEPSASEEISLVGKAIGNYDVVEKLDERRLAVSYKAIHELTEVPAVVKILSPAISRRDEIVERFIHHAEQGSVFNHPNVVRALGGGKEGDIYFIVSEYVGGRSLLKILDEKGAHGKLDPPDALDIMIQIGHALEHAYKHSVVHRDICPANIIVSADGTAELENLWLSKLISGTSTEAEFTAKGKTAEELAYMPPEQLDDAGDVDCRADIYALAATMYRALTGYVPCEGETVPGTIRKIREEIPRPVRDYNDKIPLSVIKPIERALSKDPARRYKVPHDLVIELELARKYHVK